MILRLLFSKDNNFKHGNPVSILYRKLKGNKINYLVRAGFHIIGRCLQCIADCSRADIFNGNTLVLVSEMHRVHHNSIGKVDHVLLS